MSEKEKKSRILYLLKYLEEYSDEHNPISSTDIISYLTKQGFKTHRTTITSDIALLIDAGVDVITIKSSPNKYFLGQRNFEFAELKMLSDAVMSSKIITSKKSKQLIKKIGGLTSKRLAKELYESSLSDKIIKPKNEHVYYITDIVHQAIRQEKMLEFKYLDYDENKKLIHKNSGYIYEVFPYTTFWRDDRYYLVGHSNKHEKIAVFRIDRISKPVFGEKEWKSVPSNFDPSIYANKMFEMYSGEEKTLELKCDNSLMNVIVDKFGEDVDTRVADDNCFIATVKVYVSPRFYGWLFGFSGKIVIQSPQEVKDDYVENLKNTLNGYAL